MTQLLYDIQKLIMKLKFMCWFWQEMPIDMWRKDGKFRSAYILVRRYNNDTYEVKELATATLDRDMSK